ncbi:putative diguanylate cyclase YegE [Ferriphaselus amnicola]|uniref:histidine kinase n=1 Tax=Ferriphaselus amnicola TaxID=1188319 RepID=A0A2Z6G8F3_9PROT|nr:PAS domain S-box protein [Ferriphaselus amnicola]BBE49741.1 putative diguanylate cyclase YegE [Ferriphaselus amnicola]
MKLPNELSEMTKGMSNKQNPLIDLTRLRLAVARRVKSIFIKDAVPFFQSSFELAAVGIAHVALDGTWVRVNSAVCQIVGYSHDELMKLTFQDITHPDDLGQDLANVEQLLAGTIVNYSMEKRYFHKSGDIVWIRLTVSLCRKPDGSPDFFISVIENISQLKQVEAEVKRLNQQSENLIEQQVIAQTMLALAHELNQPLNASGSYSEAALRLSKSEDLNREKLNQVLKSNIAEIKRAGDILRDLMASMHHHATADQSFEIVDTIHEILRKFKKEQVGVLSGIEVDGMSCKVEVVANRLLLDKVLRNLLVNAYQALESAGNGSVSSNIVIRVTSKQETVVITVLNDGPEILQRVVDKMFDPFFTTKERGGGMGLAISRVLIESWSGRLWYERVGEQTAFHFTLPKYSESMNAKHHGTYNLHC